MAIGKGANHMSYLKFTQTSTGYDICAGKKLGSIDIGTGRVIFSRSVSLDEMQGVYVFMDEMKTRPVIK